MIRIQKIGITKNRDALGKVLNYMYRTGRDTENDLIESCRGGYGVNMESVHSIESDMTVKKFMKKKKWEAAASLQRQPVRGRNGIGRRFEPVGNGNLRIL